MNDLEELEHLFPTVHAVAIEQHNTEKAIEKCVDVADLVRWWADTSEGFDFWQAIRNKKWEDARKLQPDLFPWRADYGCVFWSLTNGVIRDNMDHRMGFSIKCYLEHNYFRTEQEAKESRKPKKIASVKQVMKAIDKHASKEETKLRGLEVSEGEVWTDEEPFKEGWIPAFSEKYFEIKENRGHYGEPLRKTRLSHPVEDSYYRSIHCFPTEDMAIRFRDLMEAERYGDANKIKYAHVITGAVNKIPEKDRRKYLEGEWKGEEKSNYVPKEGEQYFRVEDMILCSYVRVPGQSDDLFLKKKCFSTEGLALDYLASIEDSRRSGMTYGGIRQGKSQQVSAQSRDWIPKKGERYFKVEKTGEVLEQWRGKLAPDDHYKSLTLFRTRHQADAYVNGMNACPQAEVNKTPAENPLTEWRAEEGKEYFCIYQDLLTKCRDYRLPVDNERYTSGNYFKTINSIPSNISYKSLVHPKNLKVTTEDPSPVVSPTEKETYAPSLFENTKSIVGPLAHFGVK